MASTAPGYIHISTRAAQHRAVRGFVLFVGLDGIAASAAGTLLRRLTTELRHHLASVAPGSESAAAGTPDSDPERPSAARRPDPPARHPTGPAGRLAGRGLLIDPGRREVRLDGENLDLTYKEFELLHYLVEHPDRAVGRKELLEALWPNANPRPGGRTIDVHIRRLRTKLGRFRGTLCTVHGQGYRFHEHPEVTLWDTPQHHL
jgi:DNA-binding response OmpR family regulator